MQKALFLFLFSVNMGTCYCQDLTNKRHIKTDLFKYEFYVSETKHLDLQVNDSLIYYWCRSQKLVATQGGIGGSALDGHYLKFHHSGQLAEKGSFRMGLKHGIWKTWHSNGVLRTVSHYRNGRKHGYFTEYDEQGAAVSIKKYRNNKLKPERVNQKAKERVEEEGSKEPSKANFWDRFRVPSN